MIEIKDYENYYVTENGDVYSLKTGKKKKLTPQFKNGYKFVCLFKDGKNHFKYIHRLVAEAYIPNKYYMQQINHIDEDKANNNVSNLEWCTAKYNSNFGTRNKRISNSLKSVMKGNKNSAKKVYQYTLDGEFIAEYESATEAARINNWKSKSNIIKAKNGQINTAYSYIWKATKD